MLPILLPGAVFAEAVTFEEALGQAATAPAAAGLAEAMAVREAMDDEISSLPGNPQVQVMPGWRAAPRDEEGPELQVTVTQALSLASLGDARRTAARTERDVLAMEHAAQLLERRLGSAQAWFEVWATSEELRLVRDERETVGELLAVLERAALLGERTRIDVARMRGYAAEIDVRVIAVEGRLHHEGLRLGAELGRVDGEPVTTQGEAPRVSLPAPARTRRLVAQAARMPGVAGLRLVALSHRAREVEARAQASTRLYLGASGQLDQPDGFVLFGILGAQLPVFTLAERARSAHLGEAERAEGEHAQAVRDARRVAADALHELEHTKETEAALRERLIPALDDVATLEQRALSAGESTVLRWVAARRSVLEARQRLTGATGQRIWAEMKVWLMLAALDSPEGDAPEGEARGGERR